MTPNTMSVMVPAETPAELAAGACPVEDDGQGIAAALQEARADRCRTRRRSALAMGAQHVGGLALAAEGEAGGEERPQVSPVLALVQDRHVQVGLGGASLGGTSSFDGRQR